MSPQNKKEKLWTTLRESERWAEQKRKKVDDATRERTMGVVDEVLVRYGIAEIIFRESVQISSVIAPLESALLCISNVLLFNLTPVPAVFLTSHVLWKGELRLYDIALFANSSLIVGTWIRARAVPMSAKKKNLGALWLQLRVAGHHHNARCWFRDD